MRRELLVLAVAAALGCGTTATKSSMSIDSGTLAPIDNPPLVCSSVPHGCSCAPAEGGVLDAGASLCDDTVAADASCCAGADYPFAGSCLCAANACADGGGRVSSCSSPPAEIEAGPCNPDQCKGMACAGGQCCVSSCQAGVCQSSCS